MVNLIKNKTVRWLIILIVFLILLFLIPLFSIVYTGDFGSSYEYAPGRDYIEVFGDGRFQTAKSIDDISLDDHSCEFVRTVVDKIEKYNVVGDYVYVEGYYSAGSTVNDAGSVIPSLQYENLQTCEYEWRKSQDEIPKYLILNYETVELVTYINWEDIPEEERYLFD